MLAASPAADFAFQANTGWHNDNNFNVVVVEDVPDGVEAQTEAGAREKPWRRYGVVLVDLPAAEYTPDAKALSCCDGLFRHLRNGIVLASSCSIAMLWHIRC